MLSFSYITKCHWLIYLVIEISKNYKCTYINKNTKVPTKSYYIRKTPSGSYLLHLEA